VRVTAVDNHPTTLDLAREYVKHELGSTLDATPEDGDQRDDATTPDNAAAAGGVELVLDDAKRLVDRFGPRSFDVVHAGMFIHHLAELDALTVLRIMDRLAVRGMVWNDLLRSRLAQLGVHLLTIGQGPMVQHDARVSVRAGFTAREAREMITRAGWEAPRVRAQLWHQRFVATGEKWTPDV
jgi:hypothetical protein